MAPTDTSSSNASALSPAARFLWAALIVATLYLCYFHNLGAIGLVGPDEPRYAWIARDMAESGDWVTPRLYGQPWFEKPVLYYWAAAAGFKLFGVSETTARLPSAICALLATLALAWLAWRLYGAETARWLLLLLPTTVGMIGFSHAAATDMPFAAMLTIAMVFAAILLNLVPETTDSSPGLFSFPSVTSSTSLTSLLLGFFLGLATLAKGPAAVLLSGGGVFFWAVFSKRWRDVLRCLHPLAILSFSVTALPWYILCARRNPDFFRVFIIEHNFKRFLTPEFQHIQPFWFYVPNLLAATLPWTLVFLAAVMSAGTNWLRLRPLRPQTVFLACWAIFPIVFFSISKSKLPGYILPAIPVSFLAPAVLLASSDERRRRLKRISLLLSAGLAAAFAVTFYASGRELLGKWEDLQPIITFLSLAILATFVFLLLSMSVRSRRVQITLSAFGLLSFLFLVYLGGNRKVLRHVLLVDPSARTLAHLVAQYGANSSNLQLVGVRRSTHYQLNFYLHADLPEWDGQVKPGEFLLGENVSCRRLTKPEESCKDLWGWIDKTDDWQLLQIAPRD